ncbi:MAG: Smr/MutS family protein [Parvularcula sp.]|jgi:DNA-nicking Smr family endonuclease|nr:Smr/MutS family protein [Parvularcula sp.]
MKRGSKRTLSEAERRLWNSVAATVTPYDPKAVDAVEATPAPPRTAAQTPKTNAASTKRESPPPGRFSLELSPFSKGDPRRIRKVSRGQLPIEGILDLHGMRQEEADRAVSSFIAHHRALGHRTLLVITGKGGPQSSYDEGRGVLRKRFLQGIEFGLYGGGIAAVRQAHQKHGGRGAFYILLKAKTSPST